MAALLAAVAAAPAGAYAAQSSVVSLGGLPEVIPGAHAQRARGERKHARKGISLTPSSTEAHWACPEEACEAIVEAPAQAVKVNGASRFRLPDGPLLEGGGVKGGLDPQDLQSAYEIPVTGGEDQTVALVDAYGYPTAEEDLAKYRERYRLPPCTKADGCFKKVNQKGEEANYPQRNEGWETESALDIEMVSAACPHCHIVLAEAKNSDGSNLSGTVDEAARLGATEISNSYGSAEQFCNTECEEEAPAYDHPGILIVAAGGDNGYDNHEEGDRSPNFPAGLPSVVAVGGTVLHRAHNARGWREEAWYAGGSGCTTLWQKPIWQTDTGCSKRMTDDVAAVAGCESPVSTYAQGQGGWGNVCGTSVASPLVAGIEAHASEYSRSLPGAESFYEDPQAPFDVTEGGNGTCTPPESHAYFCHAEVGYDGPTGNGTPDGPLELSSAPSPIAVTSPASAVTGSEAMLNGKVEPEGEEASYRFEYGTSTSYGTSVPVPDASAGSGRAVVPVSETITGLEPDTTYHYRLVAANANGTSYGADGAFATAAPTVTSVSPGFGPTDGGATVTIAGANLAGALAVKFGAREAEGFTVDSEGSITAVTPQGAGTVNVTVTTPAGTSETGANDRFVYDKVGPVLAWGFNEGLLGEGGYAQSDVPVEVDELPEAVALASGATASLALMGDGTVMAWGGNLLGAVGDGSEQTSPVPVEVCATASTPQEGDHECPHGPYLEDVTKIAEGGFASLALLKDGTVVAWGGNGRGQLGIGEEKGDSDVPVPVCATNKEVPCKPANYLKEVVAVAAGARYSLALLKDGTVMAWGENNEGELATGKHTGPESCGTEELAIECSHIPIAIAGLGEVSAIAAGSFHALALRKDGSVMAWGADGEGELGDGASKQRDAPTAVCAAGELAPCAHELGEVRAVSASEGTSTALLDDGEVRDWGSNSEGQLGDGSPTGPETCGSESCSRSPVAVTGLSGVTAIASGVDNANTLAVADAGEIVTWGGGGYGQLGDGALSASDVPVRVCPAFAIEPCPGGPSLSGAVTAIAAGGYHDLVSLSTALTAVTGVSPDTGRGAGGTKVTLTGEHLGGVTAVHFGASAASEFEVVSEGEVLAVSPPGSGVVNVTVTTPEGASHPSFTDEFTYEASTVTRVNPGTGPSAGGTPVTIAGTKLTGASAVRFGATAASEFEVRSASEIVAVSPPGSGVVDVTVTTPEGTTEATPADQFVYQAPPVVKTEGASAVRLSSATLNATVDPEGANVSDCQFEYGASPAYGSSIPCASSPGSGSSAVPVSASLSQLRAGTEYHFRIVAGNSQATSYGDDETFSTPSSELPELGRCVKLSHATGAYTKSSCTTRSSGGDTGKYEWQAGPGGRKGFSAKGGVAEFAPAVTGSKAVVLECSESELTGEYAGPQSASVSLVLSGCSTEPGSAQTCHSEGAGEGHVTAALQAQLGIVSAGKKTTLGWDWQAASGQDIASVVCGSETFSLTGSMIAPVTKVDKMSSAFSLAFAAGKDGAQAPESFEGGVKDIPIMTPGAAGHEQLPLAFTVSATLAGEEMLELKAIS